MKLIALIAVAVATATTAMAPAPAQAGSTLFEVVNARANARAGGPTNQFDADTLARYGALSGTRVAHFRGHSKRFRGFRGRHHTKRFKGFRRNFRGRGFRGRHHTKRFKGFRRNFRGRGFRGFRGRR